MPIDTHPRRRAPNTEQIVEEQKHQARLLKEQQAAAKAAARVPAKMTATAPGVPAKMTAAAAPVPSAADNRSAQERYIDEVAPSTIAGQMVKFSKEGKFIISETEEEIGPDQDFVALCDEVLIGYVRASRPTGTKGCSIRALRCRRAAVSATWIRANGALDWTGSLPIRGSIRSAWYCRIHGRWRSTPS